MKIKDTIAGKKLQQERDKIMQLLHGYGEKNGFHSYQI